MSYQKRLKDFFKKNDPDRLYLAKQIARNFRQDEDAVFKRLEEIYQKGDLLSLSIKKSPNLLNLVDQYILQIQIMIMSIQNLQRISQFQSLLKARRNSF